MDTVHHRLYQTRGVGDGLKHTSLPIREASANGYTLTNLQLVRTGEGLVAVVLASEDIERFATLFVGNVIGCVAR